MTTKYVSFNQTFKSNLQTSPTFYMLLFQVADDNYKALLSFFAKFPNFTQNDFFIFGESYGGIYVPTLSLRVVTGATKFNFKVSFSLQPAHLCRWFPVNCW